MLLVEFASQDNAVVKNSAESKNVVAKKGQRLTASTFKATPLEKNQFVDEAVIDEVLRLDKEQNFDDTQNSLEQALLSSAADRQLSIEETKEYKKHFVREYLKKARQAGYDIKLNDQLQVISIRQRRTYRPILIEEEEE